ncbi:MAG: radical SAM protein [Alloprevotella sp.]|nr:radical SAM protein [Alloprevotella sp.]MBR1644047.1 radical SAM protein [Bacteroidales bacterium]MBR1653271.1 radical SAM protein [Alloprevotella sp.]
MPADGKLCSFDCIYCECGLNGQRRTTTARPTREEVREALEQKLQQMAAQGENADVLTFAGNGEPTAHPEFPEIIHDTLTLRARYCPDARVSVLSNATFAHRPAVRDALLLVDNNIQKLDTVSEDYIRRVDRPQGHYDVGRVVEALRAFNGHVIVQTLFMTGVDDEGHSVDNTGEEYVRPWLEAVLSIRPERVMVYTVDRETPMRGLRKAAPEVLDGIAERLRAEGLEVEVAY